jgi:hypothetical protein
MLAKGNSQKRSGNGEIHDRSAVHLDVARAPDTQHGRLELYDKSHYINTGGLHSDGSNRS